jgi:glutamate-1-semialdehyde 2,1-aminomutase
MEMISPVGAVYQAGTLSGNPLATAAGLATLKKLNQPGFYEALKVKSDILWNGFGENCKKLGLKYAFNSVESLGCMFFTDGEVKSFAQAVKSDTKKYASFFHAMLKRGVNLAPAQFECMFVSAAHTDEDLAKTISAHYDSLKEIG